MTMADSAAFSSVQRFFLGLVAVSMLGLAVPTPPSVSAEVTNSTGGTATAVPAAADTYVRSDRRSNNYGMAAAWSAAPEAPIRRGYLRFRVPAAPAGQEIISATLKVYAMTGSDGPGLTLYTTQGGWTETGLTWKNQPPRKSMIGTAGSYSEASWVTKELTAVVPAAGGSTVNLRVESEGTSLQRFQTRENASGRKPTLTVVTAPRPDSATAQLLARDDLIYGTEIGAWRSDGKPAIDPGTGIPTLVKAAKIPLVRFAQYDVFTDEVDPAGAPGTQSRAKFDTAINGIRDNLGAEPFIKLLPITRDVIGTKAGDVFCPPKTDLTQNLSYYKSIVGQAGARVRLYESNNEMEYSCWRKWGFSSAGTIGVSSLLGQHYAQNMPALKKYARSLGFEVLTVGYAGVSGGFGWGDTITNPRVRNVHEFLVATHDAYVASGYDPDYIPDAISVHAYPYSGDFGYDAQLTDIIAYWDSWTAAVRKDIADVWGPAGIDMKLVISEWNAGNKYWAGFSDQRVSDFYFAWLKMLRRNDYWMANQFAIASNTSNPYDMIRGDGTTRRQYDTFKAVSLADPVH